MADPSGLVVALQANYLEVELTAAPDGCPQRLLCTRRHRLSHRGEAVHVGDRVSVQAIDSAQARAVIAAVEPRQSLLMRPPVANASLVVVALSVAQPAFDPDQASRFLLTAERTGLDVQVLLTKVDLIEPDSLQRFNNGSTVGYKSLAISASAVKEYRTCANDFRIQTRRALWTFRRGKKQLLNHLLLQLKLRIGAVSGRLQRGRHTTRHVELFPIGPHTRVADTPGLIGLDYLKIHRNWLGCSQNCDRSWIPGPVVFGLSSPWEPGCGVSESWERYSVYLSGLDELKGLNHPCQGG